jgi:hypothetical protein
VQNTGRRKIETSTKCGKNTGKSNKEHRHIFGDHRKMEHRKI